MVKTVVKTFLLIFGLSLYCNGQEAASLWTGHYSYNEVVDVVSGENKIFAAAQNAIFEYDDLLGELNTITTIEGLSGEQITTIYYSDNFQYLLIGYETGLIEIYSETDESVLSIVDILEKQNITPANKRINHFFEKDGLIYISTDFGISIYNLENLEFGDTYFIGDGGAQITVSQVAIVGDNIFAACLNNNGIKRADLNNPNLIDFQQWQTLVSGNYLTMSAVNDKVYSVRSNNIVYEIDGASITTPLTLPSLPNDAEVSNSNLIFSTSNAVFVYNENLQLINSFQPTADFDTSFTSATISNDFIYIGTQELGVLTTSISDNNNTYLDIKPNGPLLNETFRLNAEFETVWATYGDFSDALNPFPLRSRGLSYFNDDEWRTIPFDSVLGSRNLSEISVNPFNPNQVFICAVHDGLLELNDFEPTVLLNAENSGFESLVVPGSPDVVSVRVTDTEFDRNGLLWTISSRIDKALKSFNLVNGNFQEYSFSSLIENPLTDEDGFFEIVVDNNGTKWIGSYDNGLLAYNENENNPLRSINAESQEVLPFTRFTALALDDRNQLWIGTTKGLRVLFNTTGFYDDPSPSLSQIIILEDGIPKELLENQSISDIEVDGSNNKWIATADTGAFLVSSDGQTTIFHFTEENSPLPSNRINDIAIDEANGNVYFATTRGLLSFKAGGSTPQETLEEAFAYPNPVRPEYDILGFNDLSDINKGVKISGLTERVNIKITDIEGNLVAEAQSNVNLRSSSSNFNFAIDGGTAVWNGKNLVNSVVRSGVYLILISDLDSFESKVIKLLIVR